MPDLKLSTIRNVPNLVSRLMIGTMSMILIANCCTAFQYWFPSEADESTTKTKSTLFGVLQNDLQTRSVVAVKGWVSYSDDKQTVAFEHWRSEVLVGVPD